MQPALCAQVMLKAAEGTSVEDRARMAVLAQACVCLAQGVAFFHAGDEILRSKSLDRDAYNSGAQPMLSLCYSAQVWQATASTLLGVLYHLQSAHWAHFVMSSSRALLRPCFAMTLCSKEAPSSLLLVM